MLTLIEPADLPQWIGRETEPSPWLLIDQERVNMFADCTLDHQFIHVDAAKARETPFGGTIAHGFLTLSLLPNFLTQTGVGLRDISMAVNYGLNKTRFLKPVKVGARVRGRAVLVDAVEKHPGQFLLTKTVTVEIEGEDTPALVAEALLLYFMAEARAA